MKHQRSNRTFHNLVLALLHALIVVFVVGVAGASVLYFLFLAFVYFVLFVAFAAEYVRNMSLRESVVWFSAVTACTCWVLYRLFYARISEDQKDSPNDH